jgi:hypothetical protein
LSGSGRASVGVHVENHGRGWIAVGLYVWQAGSADLSAIARHRDFFSRKAILAAVLYIRRHGPAHLRQMAVKDIHRRAFLERRTRERGV